MAEFYDVSRGGIDDLINWLNQQRRKNPAASLFDLLGGREMDRNVVLDLACIDLMHQHRNGHHVCAEQYVRDFPQLDRTSDLLDLIDAELCVAAELQEPIDLAAYCSRFPDLATDIKELAQLDLSPEVPCFHRKPKSRGFGFDLREAPHFDDSSQTLDHPGDSLSGFSIDSSTSLDAEASSENPKLSLETISEDYPLAIPDWFLVDECIVRDKDRCLLRGRDDVRGISLAMKIVRVPHLMADKDVIALLDICEAASRVQNPHWIAPQMAVVQMGCLGVIRPWQFANAWQPHSITRSPERGDSDESVMKALNENTFENNGLNQASLRDTALHESIVLRRWRQLATVAFAVEAAHRSGATHGALHAGNLAVDHEGNACVVDATSSLVALQRWLGDPAAGVQCNVIQSLDQRIHLDVEDVVKLVRDTATWIPSVSSAQLVNQVQECIVDKGGSLLTQMGELLMQYADHYQPMGRYPGVAQQPRWRTRVMGWLSRNH
ncbi:MAG: hypothetical protein CMM05_08420 [Rhodopirellula sp.]|nr:hypothetical protein [Rhodopirellula sp.]